MAHHVSTDRFEEPLLSSSRHAGASRRSRRPPRRCPCEVAMYMLYGFSPASSMVSTST